jgi:hypothetical protein
MVYFCDGAPSCKKSFLTPTPDRAHSKCRIRAGAPPQAM